MADIPNIPGSLFGKDVSHHQSLADWTPGPLAFLIARASIGTQPDDMYDRHIRKAREADLVTGAYHFNHAPLSIKSQVSAFLDAAGNVDLFVLDVEGSNDIAFSRAQTREFIERVQETGRKIGLYMSASQFFDAGQDWDWVALWGTGDNPPNRHWDMWQFGNVGGEDGNIVKSQAVLDRIVGKEQDVTPATIVTEVPQLLDLNEDDRVFDLDGTTVLTRMNGDRVGLISPYGTAGGKRAIAVTTGGIRRIGLVTPRRLRDVPVNTTDPNPALQAELLLKTQQLSEASASLQAIQTTEAALRASLLTTYARIDALKG